MTDKMKPTPIEGYKPEGPIETDMLGKTWETEISAPTHGGPRPGSGRKHLDGTPPGGEAEDQSERHTVTMPASMWEVVKDAGGGVYSIGLRIIVNEWEELRSRSAY